LGEFFSKASGHPARFFFECAALQLFPFASEGLPGWTAVGPAGSTAEERKNKTKTPAAVFAP
jgi:hypothetical protein